MDRTDHGSIEIELNFIRSLSQLFVKTCAFVCMYVCDVSAERYLDLVRSQYNCESSQPSLVHSI